MAKKKAAQAVKITAKELVSLPIEQLVPYANNAKVHGTEQITRLRASLREFGFVAPVLVDEAGNILAGHGRVEAARLEGMTTVPCVRAEGLSEAQRKAYILADNRLAELAEWDRAMLKIELEGLDALDFGTDALGFDEKWLGDLFLDEEKSGINNTEKNHFWETEDETNEEYEAFTDKFKQKLTTDDCYTPPAVYERVKNWAVKRYALEEREIVRPFFPGGNYEAHEYPDGCVVIDNPPFSILSEICSFYMEKGIDFFLFAPGLTLFSVARGEANYVLAAGRVKYENGAVVQTAFVTNLGEYKIETAPELHEELEEAIREANREETTELPGYIYPPNVIRSADYILSKYGQTLRIPASETLFIRALDEQKAENKGIYGGGFLLSEKATAEKATAEKAAAEKAAAKEWKLSDRERTIIAELGGG